jgi:hypothetical protein
MLNKVHKIILLLLFPALSYAQVIPFTINGTVKNAGTAKYAYLGLMTAPRRLLMVPIQNGKFSFSDKVDLKGEFYDGAFLFIDSRNNITMEELSSKLTQRIWLPNRANLRSIILEDIDLEIEDKDNAGLSKVTKGGILTKIQDEGSESIRSKSVIEFVQKYADSPISLNMIKLWVKLYNLPIRSRVEALYPVKKLYPLLSARLQATPQGKQLKEKVDQL